MQSHAVVVVESLYISVQNVICFSVNFCLGGRLLKFIFKKSGFIFPKVFFRTSCGKHRAALEPYFFPINFLVLLVPEHCFTKFFGYRMWCLVLLIFVAQVIQMGFS